MNIVLVLIIIVLVTGIILYGIYNKEKDAPEVDTDITDNMKRRYDDLLQTPINSDDPANGNMSSGGQKVDSVDQL
jgi:hypothetical protein